MWVGGLEVDEVLELLNGRRLHGKEPEAFVGLVVIFEQS